MDKKNLGKKIRLARVQHGMTQAQLAEAIEIKQKSVSLYENGTSVPTLMTLQKLAKILEKPVGFFISDFASRNYQLNSANNSAWHFYDQGLFEHLAKRATIKEAEDFIERLNVELNVDLFKTGFRTVITFFSFLESIGLSSIKHIHAELFNGLVFNKEDRQESWKIISFVKNTILDFLKDQPELKPEELIKLARRQKSYVPNHVFREIFQHRFERPIEWLQGLHDEDRNWYSSSLEVLAVEFAFQFPYYEKLAQVVQDSDKRQRLTQHIYHDFFQMAIKAQSKNPNVSFYRALDRARREFANWGDAKARLQNAQFNDQFQYLRNNEDLLDSDIIHLAIFGYGFQDLRSPVYIFTLEKPQLIEERIRYALAILNWASTHMGYALSKCFGKVYCFEKGVPIKIDVSLLDSTINS
jgi:transcriptional regulator with XRE-family HTH domain